MYKNKDNFLLHFEQRLAILKETFTMPVTPQWQKSLQIFKEWRQQHQPLNVAAGDLSSLFAVPVTELACNERILHRIWLGGLLPRNVEQTIMQWQQAISVSSDDFQQMLWVWDIQQLETDSRFVLQHGNDPLQLGVLFLPGALVRVNSLSKLVSSLDNILSFMLQQLHTKGYYATLSDFFRLAILVEYGGVYIDADTLPAPPASLFLHKPEIPDFITPNNQRICWLNLYLDETGMIIARRENQELSSLLTQLSQIYRDWPQPVTDKTAYSERAIFEPFYKLWCEQLGVTQLSHMDFCQKYSVFGFDRLHERVCGIKGMRLQEDIHGGTYCALSAEELENYDFTIERLKERKWKLASPFDLEHISRMFSERELLQIAYAPQLRAEIPYYHYYGVLSNDEQLDKVNSLFCDYLIALNGKMISAGDYWETVKYNSYSILWFIPATLTTKCEQLCMAKLMFLTSYLEYCSVDNVFATDVITLQFRQNIEPFLHFITALYDSRGKLIGFINAARITDYDTVKVEFSYRNSIRPLEDAYELFIARHSFENDFFIASVALKAEEQGKGYFSQVLSWAIKDAKQQGLQRITLCVWQSSPARLIYLNKGFTVVGAMRQEVRRFSDELIFMALEV
ncbi:MULTISPECIES: GNAT family N-acetyltransferase [Enterobacter]|uniref:GNAT family N-acetyltransferase n=1 Tax=Enterobacter TaxID=547 RepID=UPI0013D4549F|nr:MULTISPECIES: GNAT family N-acetyltransferase [Enterobacter]NEV85063.1 GNAT family N-acetyltransferase [Enterobacter asburiae]NMD68636.1 GNAT family N-acetyltransferase [Enterobacter sp. DNRA5]GFM11840.1 hypothetical protein NCT2013_42580 [Enterobacter sp. M4-VN]